MEMTTPAMAPTTGPNPEWFEEDRTGENLTRGVRFGSPQIAQAPMGTGIEPPLPEWVDISQTLERWFAFVDICGFTSFTERSGSLAALDQLTRFRDCVRSVTARRGVRVLKWLGDGALLVGVDPGPVIAAACELSLRFEKDAFDVHAGIAGGHVLLFEGDDYIGPAANHASRLCEAANPGEVLALGVHGHLPDWVEAVGSRTVNASGIGAIEDVLSLRVSDDLHDRRTMEHRIAG